MSTGAQGQIETEVVEEKTALMLSMRAQHLPQMWEEKLVGESERTHKELKRDKIQTYLPHPNLF